jgi:plasmid stabilization system protein ParE
MARFDLSTQAKIDLEETWTYISEDSEYFADKLVNELISRFKLLADNPKIGAFRHDLVLDLRLFPFKNYNIFYFQREFGIEIHRLLHSSRDNIQIFDTEIDRLN